MWHSRRADRSAIEFGVPGLAQLLCRGRDRVHHVRSIIWTLAGKHQIAALGQSHVNLITPSDRNAARCKLHLRRLKRVAYVASMPKILRCNRRDRCLGSPRRITTSTLFSIETSVFRVSPLQWKGKSSMHWYWNPPEDYAWSM